MENRREREIGEEKIVTQTRRENRVAERERERQK